MDRNLTLVAIAGTLLMSAPAAPALAAGYGQNFAFVEESSRLQYSEDPGSSTTGVVLVDVDHDGDLDIFLAEGTDGFAGRPNKLLINNGAGYFSDESAARLPAGPLANANSSKASFGDVDGDGCVDAIVGEVGPEQLLLNDCAGFFSDASDQLPPPLPPQRILEDISANAQLADVNGDGDLDILISNEIPFFPGPPGAQNFLWINDGTGHFLDETAARLPAVADQTASMLTGDIDEDGDLDIVVLNRGAQEYVLVNDGDGFFSDETAARFPVTEDSTRGGALGDLDGDGDLDLITGNSRNDPVAIYFNDGAGFYTQGDFGWAPFPDETDAGLEVVDLDGDGDLDVYLPNAGPFISGHGFAGGPDRYFRNNGRGMFIDDTATHFTPPDDPTTAAAFGDLDGDGRIDLVVGNSGENGGERVFINYACGHGVECPE